MRGAGGGGRQVPIPPVPQHAGYLHEHKLVGVGEEDDRVLHRVVIVLVFLLAGRALHVGELRVERGAQGKGQSWGLRARAPPACHAAWGALATAWC